MLVEFLLTSNAVLQPSSTRSENALGHSRLDESSFAAGSSPGHRHRPVEPTQLESCAGPAWLMARVVTHSRSVPPERCERVFSVLAALEAHRSLCRSLWHSLSQALPFDMPFCPLQAELDAQGLAFARDDRLGVSARLRIPQALQPFVSFRLFASRQAFWGRIHRSWGPA